MTVTGRAGREPLGRGLAEADLRRAVGGQRGWRRGKGSRPGPEAAEAGRATWPCGPWSSFGSVASAVSFLS